MRKKSPSTENVILNDPYTGDLCCDGIVFKRSHYQVPRIRATKKYARYVSKTTSTIKTLFIKKRLVAVIGKPRYML